MLKPAFLLGVWNFGVRQRPPTCPAPNRKLGHWICNLHFCGHFKHAVLIWCWRNEEHPGWHHRERTRKHDLAASGFCSMCLSLCCSGAYILTVMSHSHDSRQSPMGLPSKSSHLRVDWGSRQTWLYRERTLKHNTESKGRGPVVAISFARKTKRKPH